ncbi:MAG: hypothetical protein IMZ75_15465 [Actinobacteria bacterium]|nr:hypothetical protein [Actinomycetota bacterium]
MRIHHLKKASLPKVAVLVTGLAVAILAATLSPPPAQALPRYASTCTGCHAAGGSVRATPSTATPAAGAAYLVAIAITSSAGGNTGYWISTSTATGGAGTTIKTGGPSSAMTYSATMTAPTGAGTYYYKVWVDKGSPPGQASSVLYKITVGDRVAPTLAMTAPAALHALTTSLVPAWSAKDAGSGLANVDARWQRAAFNGGFTAAVYPSTWQKTTATRATLSSVAPGYTYCFSARARDRAGNLSAWSPPRCSAVALDDRSLTATSGWARVTGSVYYRGTATTTTRSAVTLTRKGVQARRIYLVATKCSTCGTVGVYWNGVLLKKVSLAAASTTRRNVLAVTTFTSVRTGTLSIRTLVNGKSVQIDGVTLVRG